MDLVLMAMIKIIKNNGKEFKLLELSMLKRKKKKKKKKNNFFILRCGSRELLEVLHFLVKYFINYIKNWNYSMG